MYIIIFFHPKEYNIYFPLPLVKVHTSLLSAKMSKQVVVVIIVLTLGWRRIYNPLRLQRIVHKVSTRLIKWTGSHSRRGFKLVFLFIYSEQTYKVMGNLPSKSRNRGIDEQSSPPIRIYRRPGNYFFFPPNLYKCTYSLLKF